MVTLPIRAKILNDKILGIMVWYVVLKDIPLIKTYGTTLFICTIFVKICLVQLNFHPSSKAVDIALETRK